MLVDYEVEVIEGDGPGAGARMKIEARYDYAKNKCRCPACGGLGIPWRGWFMCESCLAIALVETGECFVIVP